MSDIRDTKNKKIFSEKTADIETIFESLSVASSGDKELLYMDMLISHLRADSSSDLTETSFNILRKLKLI